MRLPALTFAALAVVFAVAPAAVAATADPNEKTTVTDIQYRISYSREIPGNCAVLGFSQWQAAKFKGWEAYQVAITFGTPPASRTDSFRISPPPKYDDELKYGGNIISPPGGSHWVLIGDGSYRAGGPPAEAACQAILARAQAQVPDHKVTTSFRRTRTCAAKFETLTRAEKAVKKAKGTKAKAKAKKNLSKARKAFDPGCSR
jgi:hypothetical protein